MNTTKTKPASAVKPWKRDYSAALEAVTHTVEPWTLVPSGAAMIDLKGNCGNELIGTWDLATDGIAAPFNEGDGANLNRIVDCVNACAGMADPAAEIAALREALISMVDLREVHEGVMSGRKAVIDALGMARKALANIEHNHA